MRKYFLYSSILPVEWQSFVHSYEVMVLDCFVYALEPVLRCVCQSENFILKGSLCLVMDVSFAIAFKGA